MKGKSTEDSNPRRGWETQISTPLTIIDVDAEYFRGGELKRTRTVAGRRFWSRFWPWLCLTVCSLLSYFLISQFIVTTVVVQGRSMSPTLADGDRYLLHRWQLNFRPPRRGDLVVIEDAARKDHMVKRVIGLPGERVQIIDGAVWINGQRLNEPYLTAGTRTFVTNGSSPLMIIGKDRYFVLGDNRALSEDSRIYGAVHLDRILGYIPQE